MQLICGLLHQHLVFDYKLDLGIFRIKLFNILEKSNNKVRCVNIMNTINEKCGDFHGKTWVTPVLFASGVTHGNHVESTYI